MVRDDAPALLPVRTALPAPARARHSRGAAVLCAPPGTGKTTLVPISLAGLPDRGGDPGVADLTAFALQAGGLGRS
ncbi:hypothetical protein [Streptomyces pacificus]|uniref:Uncharacterized protein n=1 Tax=Streptomyces pacificus TaxID=2705029 RepID=A0A6A0ARX7_9ACTN|nr:hypothetical protein [Streptomyces pacificus]GFH35205.1 hypothetical protein SCWH03_14200 [Streptomyces pacificus]